MTDHPSMTNLTWRKSSYSGANGGDCVEIADTGTALLVRNSKRVSAGTVRFTHSEMAAFIAGCKAGEFDDLRGPSGPDQHASGRPSVGDG